MFILFLFVKTNNIDTMTVSSAKETHLNSFCVFCTIVTKIVDVVIFEEVNINFVFQNLCYYNYLFSSSADTIYKFIYEYMLTTHPLIKL